MCFPKTSSLNHSHGMHCHPHALCTFMHATIPAIPMHSPVTTSHPHAFSCHYQPSPCTLMSLPAIPMHSHVTTSHPHALSCHYQPSPCTLMSYQPSPCTLMSLPAISMHSHVTTRHPHALSCHYQPSPCTLMSLPAIPMHSHVTTSHASMSLIHSNACMCTLTLVSDPDPPCSTGCMFLITSTHTSSAARWVWARDYIDMRLISM